MVDISSITSKLARVLSISSPNNGNNNISTSKTGEEATSTVEDVQAAIFRKQTEEKRNSLVFSFADRFHEAAVEGHVDRVKQIVLEIQGALSPSPIHLPLLQPLLRYLSKAVSNDDGQGSSNYRRVKVTPLVGAACNGHADMVEFLLGELRSDPFCEADETGSLAFHAAVECCQLLVVKKLLAMKPELLEAKNRASETALNLASFYGHLDIVTFLVDEMKASVENVSANNRTPMMDAAMEGHLLVVEFLDKKCPDFEPSSDYHRSMSIYLATVNGHLPIVSFLSTQRPALLKVRDKKGDPLLNAAAYAGQSRLAEFFVEAAEEDAVAVIEERGSFGRTALITAAFRGHLSIVEYLAEQGAQLDVADSSEMGSMAVHVAAQFGYLPVVAHLLKLKPRLVEAKDSCDNSPLHRAAYGGKLDVVQFLVEQNHAPLESKNVSRQTPLAVASKQAYLDVVDYLVKQGADLFSSDDEALPVHLAASEGHQEVVAFFVEKEPRLLETATKNRQRTLLAIAALRGNLKLVEFLAKEKNANIEASDSEKMTPLLLAKAANHEQIVECLRSLGAKDDANIQALLAKARHFLRNN